ncbi:hypothetical protein C2W62_16260 [Candidatus Entotheonella serta]|nr:hypothetical protein C2W62_16260 [Candidatus Entotheonella serta]
MPNRWIVERAFSWLYKYRRLNKDYEFLTQSSESMLYIAMTHLHDSPDGTTDCQA